MRSFYDPTKPVITRRAFTWDDKPYAVGVVIPVGEIDNERRLRQLFDAKWLTQEDDPRFRTEEHQTKPIKETKVTEASKDESQSKDDSETPQAAPSETTPDEADPAPKETKAKGKK